MRFIEARIDSMLRSTVTRGGSPPRMAAFSAGSPNESQPIGWMTCIPLRRRKRATTSPIV